MQEKSALNFPFNTQVQEKPVENGSWIAVKALIGREVRVDSGKGGAGDILQSDISHLQLNTLLAVRKGMEPLEHNHPEWESIRARVDSLAAAIFLIAGGALSVSIGVMVSASGDVQLPERAIKLASQSWYWLIASIISFVLLKAHLIFQAFLLHTKTEFADKHNTFTNRLGLGLSILGLLSFVVGIIQIIMAAIVVVRS